MWLSENEQEGESVKAVERKRESGLEDVEQGAEVEVEAQLGEGMASDVGIAMR